ncbi:BatD family protein [Planctomycetota bacterium]
MTALFAGNAIGQVQVFAQVDSQKDIYVGESFTYNVIIDGENNMGQVDLTPLARYNPRSAGNRDVSQTSISIINGKTTKNVVKRYVMSYSLVSNQTGQIELGPVKVTVAGKSYQTNPVSVNIIKPGTTDQLDLEVTLSEQQCYVGQPVLMTIKFYFSADISDPQFNIPVFSGDSFYFENPDILDQQVKKFDLGSGTTVLVSQHQIAHKGKQSNVLILRKILIPKISGQLQIDPAVVSTDVVVGRSRSRDRFFDDFFSSSKQYKRFMVSSKPLSLSVLPLPEQDKPDGFYGLVGRYTISASAKPTTDVYMGDPITLTINIGGSKYLKPVQWPKLEQVSKLAANFKMPSQKATPTIAGGLKVFTQTIRPDNNQANVIPSIPLAYFDPDTGNYSVAKTKPIKLDLKPSKRLTAADIEGKGFAPINKEVEAIKKGLSANYEGPDILENMIFSPTTVLISPVYAPIWAVPLGILILSSVAKILTHTSDEKVAAKRRRQACSKTTAQLKKITSMDSSQRNEQVASIMRQYIGDRFDKMAGSLTGNDCYETIANATGDTEIADKYRQTIEYCESARYASMDVNIDSEKTKGIIQLILDIDRKTKK